MKGRRVRDSYREFLEKKARLGDPHGFEPMFMPDYLFDFQKSLVEWAIRKGRAAIFADCGLGKTIQQLVWAQNVVEKTNKPVLICTPIAVGQQTAGEAEKFGIEKSLISRDGSIKSKIVITNYQRLHYFNPNDFIGVVGDESSCLKDSDSKTKASVQEFMRTIPYRLLCTATAAPNDYEELGTSSEVLGELGWRDMITTFFKTEQAGGHQAWSRSKYRFREHAKTAFWRWVCSWSRACRKPSDLGFTDDGFQLPQLTVDQEVVKRVNPQMGRLFDVPAVTLEEQRDERRATIKERCERVAELVSHHPCSVSWCDLNDEGDLLEKLIPDCVQVSGKDSEDQKESKLIAFTKGEIPRLVTKGKIAGWGMNWQHCNYTTMFASHSFESIYQEIRRFWRFGQKNPVHAHFVTTEGESRVTENYNRKAAQAEEMFESIVAEMNDAMRLNRNDVFPEKMLAPAWL